MHCHSLHSVFWNHVIITTQILRKRIYTAKNINTLVQILSVLTIIAGVAIYWARIGIIQPVNKSLENFKEILNTFSCATSKLVESIDELKKMQDELKEKIIINEVIVKDFSARLAKLEEKIYDK